LPGPSRRRPRGCPVAGLRALAARAAGRRPAPVLARAWSARALTRPVLDLHSHPSDSRPRQQQQNAPMLPAGSHGRRAARRDPLWQLARRLRQQPVPERVGCADPTLRARRAGNPYGDEHGVFGDNQFRYALLSLAGVRGSAAAADRRVQVRGAPGARGGPGAGLAAAARGVQAAAAVQGVRNGGAAARPGTSGAVCEQHFRRKAQLDQAGCDCVWAAGRGRWDASAPRCKQPLSGAAASQRW